MRHSVVAPTHPRALGIIFLGFARQASTVMWTIIVAKAGRTAVTSGYAHGFLGHLSLQQVVPTAPTAPRMFAYVPNLTRLRRSLACSMLAYCGACFFQSTVVHAEPSKLPPEVGYNYDQIETGRSAAKGDADRALS